MTTKQIFEILEVPQQLYFDEIRLITEVENLDTLVLQLLQQRFFVDKVYPDWIIPNSNHRLCDDEILKQLFEIEDKDLSNNLYELARNLLSSERLPAEIKTTLTGDTIYHFEQKDVLKTLLDQVDDRESFQTLVQKALKTLADRKERLYNRDMDILSEISDDRNRPADLTDTMCCLRRAQRLINKMYDPPDISVVLDMTLSKINKSIQKQQKHDKRIKSKPASLHGSITNTLPFSEILRTVMQNVANYDPSMVAYVHNLYSRFFGTDLSVPAKQQKEISRIYDALLKNDFIDYDTEENDTKENDEKRDDDKGLAISPKDAAIEDDTKKDDKEDDTNDDKSLSPKQANKTPISPKDTKEDDKDDDTKEDDKEDDTKKDDKEDDKEDDTKKDDKEDDTKKDDKEDDKEEDDKEDDTKEDDKEDDTKEDDKEDDKEEDDKEDDTKEDDKEDDTKEDDTDENKGASPKQANKTKKSEEKTYLILLALKQDLKAQSKSVLARQRSSKDKKKALTLCTDFDSKPQVFINMKRSSCYFHVCMQLIYQMKLLNTELVDMLLNDTINILPEVKDGNMVLNTMLFMCFLAKYKGAPMKEYQVIQGMYNIDLKINKVHKATLYDFYKQTAQACFNITGIPKRQEDAMALIDYMLDIFERAGGERVRTKLEIKSRVTLFMTSKQDEDVFYLDKGKKKTKLLQNNIDELRILWFKYALKPRWVSWVPSTSSFAFTEAHNALPDDAIINSAEGIPVKLRPNGKLWIGDEELTPDQVLMFTKIYATIETIKLQDFVIQQGKRRVDRQQGESEYEQDKVYLKFNGKAKRVFDDVKTTDFPPDNDLVFTLISNTENPGWTNDQINNEIKSASIKRSNVMTDLQLRITIPTCAKGVQWNLSDLIRTLLVPRVEYFEMAPDVRTSLFNNVGIRTEFKYETSEYLVIQVKLFSSVKGKTSKCTKVKWSYSDTLEFNGTYDLLCVINHIGSSWKSGHYVAFLKYDEQWWIYDDLEDRREMNPTFGKKHGIPYILLFKRRAVV
jgi:hypothetical protein